VWRERGRDAVAPEATAEGELHGGGRRDGAVRAKRNKPVLTRQQGMCMGQRFYDVPRQIWSHGEGATQARAVKHEQAAPAPSLRW